MRKTIIGTLTFASTLLIGLSAFWIAPLSNSPQIQDTFCLLLDNSAPKQNLSSDNAEPSSTIPDSINLTPCKNAASAKKTLSYKKKAVSMGILLNQRALCGVLPEYPLELRNENLSGLVMVYVQINEKGEVVEANSKIGQAPLRPLAEESAYQTKFPPFRYKGEIYRVFGLLIYNYDSKDGVSLINPTSPKNIRLLRGEK